MDVTVFPDVYCAQFTPMVRLAYVTLGSLPAAEDVVQDAFAGAARPGCEGAASNAVTSTWPPDGCRIPARALLTMREHLDE